MYSSPVPSAGQETELAPTQLTTDNLNTTALSNTTMTAPISGTMGTLLARRARCASVKTPRAAPKKAGCVFTKYTDHQPYFAWVCALVRSDWPFLSMSSSSRSAAAVASELIWCLRRWSLVGPCALALVVPVRGL